MIPRRLIQTIAAIATLALALFAMAAVTSAAPLTARPQMALGFDDAPLAPGPLLITLEQKHVKAIFFMIGELADADPALALSIADAGMPIGNHSYDHPDFTTATAGEIYDNLARAQSAIYADTGVTPTWYRSPFLSQNPAYNSVLPELGLKISWPDINPKDWNGTPPQDIINLVRDQEFAGAVVELHDQSDDTNTVDALPGLIDGLHDDGYDLVDLDDIGLGAIEGTATEKGGSALSGVLVTAYNSSGVSVGSTSTGPGGLFRLRSLSPGSYRVGFSLPGHMPRYYDGARDLAHATAIVVTGNYTIAGASAALQLIDTTPPVTSISPTLPAGWANHPVPFSLTATDSPSGSGVAATHYRLNAGVTTTYTVPVSVSAEGTNAISYWSTDIDGNTEATKTATIRIDLTAPHTTGNAPGGWHQGPVSTSLVATDALSGVAATFFRLNGTAAMTYTTPIVVAAEGTNTIAYWSVDAAGNAEATRTATVLIDQTAPHTSDNAPPGWQKGNVSVRLAPVDALSGVAYTYYRLNGSATTTYATPIVVAAEGTNTIAYWSVDGAGNVEATQSATVRVDKTPPHTTDDSVGGWHMGPDSITLSRSDGLSGVSATYYRLDGGATATYTAPIAVSADGTNTVAYWSTDIAGNVEATQSATVLLDQTPPHTTDNAPPGWQNAGVSVTLAAADAHSAVAATYYRLNGSASATYTAPITVAAEGTNTLAYWSVDAAANAEPTRSATVLIDKTAPSLSLDATASYTGSATIRATASDALSGLDHVDMALDAGPWTTEGALVVNAPGTHTVLARAFDVAGNERDTSAAIRVAAPDASPPVTFLHAAPAANVAGWNNSDVTATLVATDGVGGSGVAATYYVLNGVGHTYSAPVVLSAEGTNTVAFSSVDAWGNVEATNTAALLIDKTAPLLSLDATTSYVGSATVHASATDSLSGLDHVQTALDAGSWSTTTTVAVSATGTHTVHARAFDVADNETDASATFVVVPTTPVVIVLPTITKLSGPTSVKIKTVLKLTGTVTPSAAPGSVTVVRWAASGTKWNRIGAAKVGVTHGGFTYSFPPGVRGHWRFVASYSGGTVGSATYGSSPSVPKFVLVK